MTSIVVWPKSLCQCQLYLNDTTGRCQSSSFLEPVIFLLSGSLKAFCIDTTPHPIKNNGIIKAGELVAIGKERADR